LIHGKDTYKKIKLDLRAMNEFLNNTKESEHAPPRSNSSVKCPMEQYLTPLSDEETHASYQSWIKQLKAKKKQRQLKMLHDKMSLQKDFLPPVLTFEQFWARMKHHSRNLRVLGVPLQPTEPHGPYQTRMPYHRQKKPHQTKAIHGPMG